MTTGDVSRKTGATLRQLQVWEETGLVKPGRIAAQGPGRGTCRAWSDDDLRIVSVIVALRAKKVSLGKIRLVLRKLQSEILSAYPQKRYLVMDPSGTNCSVESDSNAGEMCLAMARSTVPWVLVELDRPHRRAAGR